MMLSLEVGILTWLVFFALVFFLAYWYLTSKPWKKPPPGPVSLPIIGSLLSLDLKDIVTSLKKLQAKYGNIIRLDLGVQRVVMLSGYDVIREALVKSGTVFCGRSPTYYVKEVIKDAGISFTQGRIWQENRCYIIRVLRDLGWGKSVMENVITIEVEDLLKNMKGKTKSPWNANELIIKAVSNVTLAVAFERRFEYSDPKGGHFIGMSSEVLKLIGTGNLLAFIPFLKYLPGDLFGLKRLKEYSRLIDDELLTWIEDCRKQINTGVKPNNLIAEYLVDMENSKGKVDSPFSEFQLLRILTDLFAAGTDTTSCTLAWAILYMILHPDIQHKVQREIDDVIGSDRLPNIDDRSNMPYTEAVLSETQRFGNIVPLLLNSTTEATTLRGYSIPQGTMVLINLATVHSDQHLWSEPDKFQPERFLDANGQYIKREELIPFSFGKRVCIGEGLARMELFMFFTSMLQQFKFRIPDGATSPDTKGVKGIVIHPQPYDVIIEDRI